MSEVPDTALAVGSSNFETCKFTHVDDHTLRIQPTIGSLIFGLVFFLIGGGLVAFWISSVISESIGYKSIFLLLGGLLFSAIGIAIYRSSNKQLIINQDTGAAFIRSWWPSVPLDSQSMYRHVLPQEINAIQLVSRTVTHNSKSQHRRGGKRSGKTRRSYTEFQVNICTIDDERVNAFLTLQLAKAEKTGSIMAQILNVPLVNHIKSDDAPASRL